VEPRDLLRFKTVGDVALSPDGERVAFTVVRIDEEADEYRSSIFVADSTGAGKPAELTSGEKKRASAARWSPDGRWIAFLSDREREKPQLYVMPAKGGEARRLTDLPLGVLPASWSPDGTRLLFGARVADDAVQTIVGGERQITYASAVAGTRLAYAAADPRDPAEVFSSTWEGTDERRLTQLNETLASELLAPLPTRRVFDTPNGKIEGWVITPRGANGPAPLLLDVHGGPAGYAGDAFALGYFFKYVLASKGWAVLSLNPTGSGSYGREHAHGIRGRWGEHDLPEQLAAIDALVADGTVDPERLAIAGYSYGGFMTSWTIGHTGRFKAAVVGAPVVAQESFHGTSDIGMWFAPWELNAEFPRDRETLRRFSPISYVEHVTAPTLILHGEADERCPIGQGEQYFAALLACGRVKTEFVRYPGGSHLFIVSGRPSHRVDFAQRVVDWVTAHTR
jgi:dipeptidyl aminopeptidase/acylaminoacyl peptidase